jgi:hypothetical protein
MMRSRPVTPCAPTRPQESGHAQASARLCRWTIVRRLTSLPVVIAVILATVGVVALARHYYSHDSCHFGSACYSGLPKRLRNPCWSPYYPDSPGVIASTISIAGSPTTSYVCGG